MISSYLFSILIGTTIYIIFSEIQPLMVEADLPMGDDSERKHQPNSFVDDLIHKHFASNPEFFKQAFKFLLCFGGLQASYLTWGIMQEKIMTTEFTPTPRVPNGKFPSAAFCVFSNRFLAVIVALICVRVRKGAFFANNTAPLWPLLPVP